MGEVAVPQRVSDVLADFLDELHHRVRREIAELDEEALYWQPDPGANSIGVTVWHFTRWLDVLSVRFLDGLASDAEIWLANDWAADTGYDPRGLGEGGLGVLTGYDIGQVLAIPRLSSPHLLAYQRQVLDRLRPQILRLSAEELGGDAVGSAVMGARAAMTGGQRPIYGWLKLLLIGSFQHLGEIAALASMHARRGSLTGG